MRQFFTLYRFEIKKIFQKPYVPALLALSIALTLFLNVRPLLGEQTVAYVDEQQQFHFEAVSNYEAIQLERRFAREDAGKLLDNEAAWTMQEMNRRYQEIYNQYAPDLTCVLLNHSLVFETLGRTGVNPVAEHIEYPADYAYQSLERGREEEFSSQLLSQEEIAYWEREGTRLTTPFVMEYTGGWRGILEKASWLNLMALVFALISLCSSFSDDDAYKTRPLLASAAHSRMPLTLARLAAGVSLACGCVLLLFGLTAAIQFFVHGAGGAQMPIQLLLFGLTAAIQFFVHGAGGAQMPIQLLKLKPDQRGIGDAHLSYICRDMTAGQSVLVTVGMSLLIALFAGALSMLLSKLLRRGVPALALPLGLLLLSMIFEPPFYYYDRVRAQIWSYMPFLADERLVSLGGVQLDCIPVSVLLYGGLAAVALVTCIWLCKARAVDKM